MTFHLGPVTIKQLMTTIKHYTVHLTPPPIVVEIYSDKDSAAVYLFRDGVKNVAERDGGLQVLDKL